MPQAKLTAFLSKQTSPKQKKASSQSGRPRQARLGDMPGVVRLPKMSGHATEAELQRLLSQLDQSSSDDALVQTLKQLACYEVTVDQLEAFPLGKRVKQLRQHSNPVVQQQATRLLQKMRQDVKDACSREAKAKPILAHFRKRSQKSATLDDS